MAGPVTAEKTERLMKLLIMLLVQRHFVAKARIREALYPGLGDEAFEKKFERDKEELRSLGVPVEVGQIDAFFDDEPGYRIRADEFALPEIRLDAEEASVVGLAGKVWQHARLAEATTDALRKLAAQGVDVDADALDLVQPRIGAEEPSFLAFWEATSSRTPLAFEYGRVGQEPVTRHLRPWGVVRSSGRWYVVGHDSDRDAERVFRLSRVAGQPRPDGPPGGYTVPEDVDVAATARRLAPPALDLAAQVLVRADRCIALRRMATEVTPDVPGPDRDTGWDRLELARADLAAEVLSHGADAVVLGPPELREDVLARLSAVVGEDR
jgi:proteasome accessory factor B